nr:flagellar motor stator protein MotA [Xenorhabdus aichiensis]
MLTNLAKGYRVLVLLGYIVVFGAVIGGYLLVGGHMGALYQPAEFLIIAGAGIGAFIVGNNGKAIKATLRVLPKVLRRSKYNKAMYMDLMALLFRLLSKSRQNGLLALERDIENPHQSDIFTQYPRLLKDPYLMDFITDYMRLIISGNMNPHEIEALMDEEIETYEQESEVPATSLAIVGDSLPAFGIVAAVMGVVHALGSADRPAGELGALIAHAMVGTFLGILLAYGFVSPLATLLRQRSSEQVKMMQCIKITLLSNLNGYAPQIAVEFGRKTLFLTDRPSFTELEEHVRRVKAPVQQEVEE